MKIIGGTLKGSTIETSKYNCYKPIPAMMKEAIFNVLCSLKFYELSGFKLMNSKVLDIFSGAGTFSFEALSRGALSAVAIDKDRDNIASMQKNCIKLSLENSITTLRADATKLPRVLDENKCNIAFVDPPFNQNLVLPTIKSIVNRGWMEDDGIILIRTHINEKYDIRSFCTEIFSRQYRKSLVSIYKINNA